MAGPGKLPGRAYRAARSASEPYASVRAAFRPALAARPSQAAATVQEAVTCLKFGFCTDFAFSFAMFSQMEFWRFSYGFP